MNTRKEISTISYCSKDFLINKLNYLLKEHIIADYMMIWHLPEEDEKKGHWHLWIEPNGQLDTMNIQDMLTEYNEKDPEKPFKCITFCSSDFHHWIPYVLHDKTYLIWKGQSRKYHYSVEDIISCDLDTFDYKYHKAFYESDWFDDIQKWNKIEEGIYNPVQLIRNRVVPFSQVGSLKIYSDMVREDITFRNGRVGHE